MSKRSADTMDDPDGNENEPVTSTAKRVTSQIEVVYIVFDRSKKGSQFSSTRMLGAFSKRSVALNFMVKYVCRVLETNLKEDESSFKNLHRLGDSLTIEHHFTTTIYMRKILLSDESLINIELRETIDVVDNELVLPRPQDKFYLRNDQPRQQWSISLVAKPWDVVEWMEDES